MRNAVEHTTTGNALLAEYFSSVICLLVWLTVQFSLACTPYTRLTRSPRQAAFPPVPAPVIVCHVRRPSFLVAAVGFNFPRTCCTVLLSFSVSACFLLLFLALALATTNCTVLTGENSHRQRSAFLGLQRTPADLVFPHTKFLRLFCVAQLEALSPYHWSTPAPMAFLRGGAMGVPH